ncbi:MAG TPA: serine/threonine-protein kinase [Polyangiaceae bacterium]|nr:serine/threonine-protein kinase [Polyangiaceae bacterium]
MFPQIFGKYVLEREIAAGGMARVFLATLRGAVGFEKRLVVKQIRAELAVDEAFVRRFVDEAKTAVELSHPNIVPVYELGVEQGVYYIAMEHCSGVTLSEVLARTGPLDPEEGAQVGAEVCRALEYAHRRAGIVHRDVTPRNVLLDDEGGVRLIDFGIAAPVEAPGGRREVFGSPGHMPPEQLRGDALGPEADVFAVGALLIEAWTNKPPFRRATSQESALALREKVPSLAESVPALAPVAELLAQSVAFDAKDRARDAEVLGRGLRDFLRASDSVEVARRLAARVRRARPEEARDDGGPATAPSTPPDSTPPLVTPAGHAPTTTTFAARDEMVEWTRKFSSIPPPLAPPSTRRLSTAPAARDAPRVTRRPLVWAGVAAALVAVFALGLGLLGAPPSPAAAPQAKAGGPSARTAPSAAATPSVAAAAPEPSAAPPPEKPAAPLVLATVVAPAPTHAPRTSPAPTLPVSTPASSGGTATASATAKDVAALAVLRLTADPQAMVSVDGAGFSQTSATPVRALSVPPGSYRVTFRSETYGAPVVSEVMLAAGAHRSVHADFRAAAPSVIVR